MQEKPNGSEINCLLIHYLKLIIAMVVTSGDLITPIIGVIIAAIIRSKRVAIEHYRW
jgi:hypothetical protein